MKQELEKGAGKSFVETLLELSDVSSSEIMKEKCHYALSPCLRQIAQSQWCRKDFWGEGS